MGSSIGLVPVGPAKVKACESILFTEGTPDVKIKNNCLIKLTNLYIFSWFMFVLLIMI